MDKGMTEIGILPSAMPADGTTVTTHANVESRGLSNFDPKLISEVQNTPPPSFIPQQLKCTSSTLKELKNIHELASKFLESFMALEASSPDSDNIESPMKAITGTPIMQLDVVSQNVEEKGTNNQSKELTEEITQLIPLPDESNMQLQQVHDVEPAATKIPAALEVIEMKASHWVNSHILELSNTYEVDFEGFEKETLALLIKLDKKKALLEKKEQEKIVTTPKGREVGKNELKNLQSSLNEHVEGVRNRGKALSLSYK
ncbi:hypothetical protein BC332_02948 [Capsicum chinense]|nr:hypothetical protein BC332_02948 [Capsicum chinense]